MLATIEKKDETYIALFERHFDHSLEEVWSWLTENNKLAQWFSELRVEDLRHGGCLTFDMQDGNFEELQITAFTDLELLEFQWGEDSVRFELSPVSNGCRLVLIETIHQLTDHTPKDLAGWHVCLDVIRALMNGDSIERMQEWKKWYEEYKRAIEKINAN